MLGWTGVLPNSPNTILQGHSFFRGIEWANIHRYSAPFRPELHNPEDTRHFDDDIPAEVCSVSPFSSVGDSMIV